MKINDFPLIIEGHINEILNRFADLSTQRMEICKKCPLYKMTAVGPLCANNYLDKETGEVFDKPQEGKNLVKGCLCRLNAKTKTPSAKCPARYW